MAQTMSSKLLLLPAAVLTLTAVGADAATNGAYKGRTEQNRLVTFTIKNGKVREFQAGVLTYCNTMNDNRFNTDAIANLPAIKIKGSRFDYKDEDVEVHGRIKGAKVTGTVSLSRADSTYYNGQTYFGVCAAYDKKFTAKR
jgi:hypothetical protein